MNSNSSGVTTANTHPSRENTMNSNSSSVSTPNTFPSNNASKHRTSRQKKRKSKSIPITNHISRTESEIRLAEDEAMAEYRDICMYNRIVTGLSRRQEECYANRSCEQRHGRSLDFLYENGACIENIIRTRHQQHPDDCESLHARYERHSNDGRAPRQRPKSADDTQDSNTFLGPTFPMLHDEPDQIFSMDP
jgi:hypothetical protein